MESVLAPGARRVAIRTKLAYGFGSIAYGIKDNGFQTLLLLYYNQVIGVRADLVGLAILIALVIDAFVDPVVGHLSDQTKSRWGRRHPWMYAAALPVGLLYLLLWNPPVSSPAATLAWLVVVAVLVRTAISAYEVPSSALAPELTGDYDERTSILGYRYLFGWLGGMGMTLITFVVLLAPTSQYPVGQLNPAGYHAYALIAAATMTLAIFASAFGTHDQIRHLPRPAPASRPLSQTFGDIVGTLGNRAFIVLLISGIFGFTSQGLTFALSTYLNTYFWAFQANVLGIFTLVIIGGVMLAFAIAASGSRLLGKKQTAAAVMAIYPVIGVSPYALRYAGLYPANGDPALLPLLMANTLVATALGVAGSILSASMMSDVVEDAQLRSGERTEGLFFAGAFFMQKCVSGLGLFLSGAILAAVHFPTGAAPGTVPEDTLGSLVLIYATALVALGLCATMAITRFPLGGRREHEQRLASLAEAASHGAPLPGSETELPQPAE